MTSEVLIGVSALLGIIFVFVAARLGSRWLYGAIAANLILVALMGAKLIDVFGFSTNAGNIFYASVFLATHFLLDRKDKELTRHIVWFGAAILVFFIVAAKLVVLLPAVSPNDPANVAITTLFSFSPRIVFASVLAYVFAQQINISIFSWLNAKTNGRHLWLRINGANFVAQLADSSIFFTIAFIDLPGALLVQAIVVGTFLKTGVVLLGTPMLYLDRYLRKSE